MSDQLFLLLGGLSVWILFLCCLECLIRSFLRKPKQKKPTVPQYELERLEALRKAVRYQGFLK